jgi:hypothetical protein
MSEANETRKSCPRRRELFWAAFVAAPLYLWINLRNVENVDREIPGRYL